MTKIIIIKIVKVNNSIIQNHSHNFKLIIILKKWLHNVNNLTKASLIQKQRKVKNLMNHLNKNNLKKDIHNSKYHKV